jgi:hypothetical protein
LTAGGHAQAPGEPSSGEAIERAIRFLAAEVPAWPREKKCFSCHNSGDGARALLAARAGGFPVEEAAIGSTLDWLRRPSEWSGQRADESFADNRLQVIQFSAALVASISPEAGADRSALGQAAEKVALCQAEDGSWQIQLSGAVGTPVAYGQALATTLALGVLAADGREKHREAIERGQRWLVNREPANVVDAAAILVWVDPEAKEGRGLRDRALDVLRQGESAGGGWGPYISSPAETFDTALGVWALARWPKELDSGARAMLVRGRAYLHRAQEPDGGWIETTRTPNVSSYAQRMSTSAWALLALVESERVDGQPRKAGQARNRGGT